MLSSDGTKAGGKPRKGKTAQDGGNAKQRKRKAAAQVPEMKLAQGAPEEIRRTAAATENASPDITPEAATPLPCSIDTPPIVSAAAEQSSPASYRSIAEAWGNYSRTWLEQTRSCFEKLAGVRSLGAAFEVQAEFAKQACDTFVAQSQRIGELQGELAKQRLKRLEGFMEKMTLVRR